MRGLLVRPLLLLVLLVADLIATPHAAHDAPDGGADGRDPKDLVPIYTDLKAYSQVTAAADVREEIDRAKGSLAGGQVEEAAVALERARSQIVYVEIDVPVKETLVRLNRTLSQLAGKDYLAANATLRDAEGHLLNFAEIASIEVDKEIVAVGTGPE